MTSLKILLAEYDESHQHATNKIIHWICVPSIFFSLVGLLFPLKLPVEIGGFKLNVAVIVLALAMIYYFRLSKIISFGMLLFAVFCLAVCYFIEKNGNFELWKISTIFFIAAWLGQFYGHKIEGKKPSFFKDLQFLLIGPAWLLHFMLNKLKIKF